MNLLENNFVINLEKRNDRLEHVREFEKLGIQLTNSMLLNIKDAN